MLGISLLQHLHKQAQAAWNGISMEQLLEELHQIQQFVLLYPLSTNTWEAPMVDEIRELSNEDFARAIPRRQRERIMRDQIDPVKDVVAQLRNWEQGRRSPEGPALALLRIAARHPRARKENLAARA